MKFIKSYFAMFAWICLWIFSTVFVSLVFLKNLIWKKESSR